MNLTEILNFTEKHELFSKFYEGSELGDAVSGLLDSAWSLSTMNYDDEATAVLKIAENLIKDHVHYLIYESGDWDLYSEFDDDVYLYITGKEKVSKEKFESETEVFEFYSKEKLNNKNDL